MKAHPKKFVQINFEYRSNTDLIQILESIRKDIRNGERSLRGSVAGFDYSLRVSSEHSLNQKPRIETINGFTCEIYQSKINQENESK